MMQLPFYTSLDEVREAASGCQACGRARQRTQVVFGDGDPAARLMLVAEYPSQTDDGTGRPFTGPAGNLLDELLEECGVSRDQLWITNLVRCYATETGRPGDRIRGAARREIDACRVWMDLELQFVDPSVVLAIGAPAATVMLGSDFRLSEQRGTWKRGMDGRWLSATLQPAYLLRLGQHDPPAAAEWRKLIAADIAAAVERAEIAGGNESESG